MVNFISSLLSAILTLFAMVAVAIGVVNIVPGICAIIGARKYGDQDRVRAGQRKILLGAIALVVAVGIHP